MRSVALASLYEPARCVLPVADIYLCEQARSQPQRAAVEKGVFKSHYYFLRTLACYLDPKTKISDATDRATGASGLSRGVRGVTQTKPGRKILKIEAARARRRPRSLDFRGVQKHQLHEGKSAAARLLVRPPCSPDATPAAPRVSARL